MAKTSKTQTGITTQMMAKAAAKRMAEEAFAKTTKPVKAAPKKEAAKPAKKAVAKPPVVEPKKEVFHDDMTLAEVTGIIQLGKGNGSTDEGSGLPVGTYAALAKQGYCTLKDGYYRATPAGKAKVRAWLEAALAKQKAEVKVEKEAAPKKAKPRTSGKVELTAKVKLLVEKNPSREGTLAHSYFEMLRKSKTVADYIGLGGSQNYLVWFIDRAKVSAE